MKYDVRFYRGDYITRQRRANADKAVVYVEHHFNAGSATASYSLANVGSNAGATSKKMAADYVRRVCQAFGTKPANNDFASGGVSVGGYKGRGDGNLKHTAMPAMLLEPLFVSNLTYADVVRSDEGQSKLATCLVETIKQFFPDGGIVAFSVGHKYRDTKPKDRGADLAGGGAEAEYAEKVLLLAAAMLEAV